MNAVMISMFLISSVMGLVMLWFAGGRVVTYAVKVAPAFGVTRFFIAFILLPIVANIPELCVAISSALTGVGQMAAGDVVGANFTETTLILGITLLVTKSIILTKNDQMRSMVLLALSSIIMAINLFIGQLTRFYGLVLIACYAGSLLWVYRHRTLQELQEAYAVTHELLYYKGISFWYTKWGIALKLFMSLLLVLASSMVVVHSVAHCSYWCGLPLETVGATVVAMGTSLPELVVSLNALKSKEYGLVVGPTLGNVLGHGTLVLGTLTFLSDIPIDLTPLRSTSCFMFATFALVGYSLFKKEVGRLTGIALLALFFFYLIFHAFIK
ncbi:hypothetical protein K2W90_03430 [Candidatus Babeliales bacterium]|nr:hypothetical protein [Candidatus Babeliales bacterium]